MSEEKRDKGRTAAEMLLESLNDGRPYSSVLDGYTLAEALAILDSITAEIKGGSLGGRGFMDSAEEKGTRVDFEDFAEGISYPYRRPGLDQNGCRVIVYAKNSLTEAKLEQFIEDKIRFFEGLNKSAEAEFIRQTLITFNEKQLAELIKKHDSTFSRNTMHLQERLIENYEERKKTY